MKCIVSGCEIPARAQLQSPLFTTPWWACGVHRRVIVDLVNEAHKAYRARREIAHEAATKILVEGMDALGDHEAERELEYPLALAT